jgi:hypothetical protein
MGKFGETVEEPRHPGASRDPVSWLLKGRQGRWIPACAGMTSRSEDAATSRLHVYPTLRLPNSSSTDSSSAGRENSGRRSRRLVIPAQAGIQCVGSCRQARALDSGFRRNDEQKRRRCDLPTPRLRDSTSTQLFVYPTLRLPNSSSTPTLRLPNATSAQPSPSRQLLFTAIIALPGDLALSESL